MSQLQKPQIWTIRAGEPFLQTLIAAIDRGQLFPKLNWQDPLMWTNVTLMLPTRKAIKNLNANFHLYTGREVGFLPKMICLGEFENDDDLPQSTQKWPAISLLERKLILLPLVEKWLEHFQTHEQNNQQHYLPQLLLFIDELLEVIDVFTLEHAQLDLIQTSVSGQYDEFWLKSLAFLDIVLKQYPPILAHMQKTDPKREYQLRALEFVEKLKHISSNQIYVLAGSTGSVKSTALMMSALARHSHGAVVLPSFDVELDANTWDLIAQEKTQNARLMTHPQYYMSHFVHSLGLVPQDVVQLCQNPSKDSADFRELIALGFRPSEGHSHWQQQLKTLSKRSDFGQLGQHLTYIEASHLDEEAQAIACILRNALEDQKTKAMVITPNRILGMRIQEALRKFGVHVSDSAGVPLNKTRAAQLLLEAIGLAFEPGPLALDSFLFYKPKFQIEPSPTPELLDLLNVVGCHHLKWKSWEQLFAELHQLKQPENLKYGHRAMRKLTPELLEQITALLSSVYAIFQPLYSVQSHHWTTSIEHLFCSIVDPKIEGYDQVLAFLEHLKSCAQYLTFDPKQLRAMLDLLLSAETAYDLNEEHPQLRILGPIEARLMHADVVILAGLNEGEWPGQVDAGAFLNRALLKSIGLSLPERTVGLQAHDFYCALFGEQVYLTRSRKNGGQPQSISRFLERLELVFGEHWLSIAARGEPWLRLARTLDLPEQYQTFSLSKPTPKAPLARKKLYFSVSELDHLMRDKYSYFASAILHLQPIDDGQDDNPSTAFGQMVHEGLAHCKDIFLNPPSDHHDLIEYIMSCFKKAGETLQIEPLIQQSWQMRLDHIARWLCTQILMQAPDIEDIHLETSGRYGWTTTSGINVSMSARADRIDLLKDGRVRLIDYKTGAEINLSKMKIGLKAQLPLEAFILQNNGFDGLSSAPIASLNYIFLKGRHQKNTVVALKGSEAEDLSVQYFDKANQIIEYVLQDDAVFEPSSVVKDIKSQYLHLSRIEEWSVGVDDASEDFDG